MKNSMTICLLLLLRICTSCSNADEAPILEPANLTIEIAVFSDGSGLAEITCQAENVVEYTLDTGEDGVELLSNSDGFFSHTYSSTGTYAIEIKAIGTSGRFLRESRTIVIQVGEDGPPADEGYTTPLAYDGMKLIWQDEFNGSSLNETFWNYEIGTGSNGWGNNELQYYREDNTSVSDGYLTIEARKESFNGRSYTSSRLTTEDKFDFNYGRVDIRARLPEGQGIWPALWMLGANFRSVGWPSCGEIDIMELIGGGDGRDDVVYGTAHWDNDGTKADFGGNTQLSSGKFSDQFHVFTIIWDANSITWFLNDQQFHTMDITPTALSELRNNFFLIFNVAVGGNWPGSPNATTTFPQRMFVDYIRVFQDE
ncbi:glycoside hydrolase family 16 protein [Ekhidna sp.]|uniref:glycoside hydrolase family 16 protein n=1 Tax=Ekhidna sp. TaxID=2608089 RepID=UPI0032EDA5C7